MSEDFYYIPYKYDWHKNKNTLRYKHFHYMSCKNDILECNRNLNKEKIPVTIIDEYFDNKFIDCTNMYSNYQFVILIILIQSTYNIYINYKPNLSE